MGLTSTDWLLSLHVLSASVMVGSLTLVVAALLLAPARGDPENDAALHRVLSWATPALGVGMIAAAALGVWLVIDMESHAFLDAWVVGALVLWFVTGGLAGRSRETQREEGRGRRALFLQLAAALIALVILVLMIWRPLL